MPPCGSRGTLQLSRSGRCCRPVDFGVVSMGLVRVWVYCQLSVLIHLTLTQVPGPGHWKCKAERWLLTADQHVAFQVCGTALLSKKVENGAGFKH